MRVSESHWQSDGDSHSLTWGGRVWTLRLDGPGPGLRCEGEPGIGPLLSLRGLAARGRLEERVFTTASLLGVERYRSRIQATYAPAGWDELRVRAAWSPSCDGSGVDLEIQASATSVGLLHDVEVLVQSQWGIADPRALSSPSERRVLPRDVRSAALSYDGRETVSDLRRLVTLALSDQPRFQTVSTPGIAGGLIYLEMVSPNDVARLIRAVRADSESPTAQPLELTYGLFGYEFEKGVVFRARLRGRWIRSQGSPADAGELYRQFLDEPPPLGP